MTTCVAELQINMFRVEDVAVFVLHGEMDTAAAPSLAAAFGSIDGGDHVYVDCADVIFVDSEGLRPLLELARRNVLAGGPLHVRASTPVRRLIDLIDVEYLFALD